MLKLFSSICDCFRVYIVKRQASCTCTVKPARGDNFVLKKTGCQITQCNTQRKLSKGLESQRCITQGNVLHREMYYTGKCITQVSDWMGFTVHVNV